jgi:uncharacterized protein YacL
MGKQQPVILDTCALNYPKILVIAFRERLIKSRRVVITRGVCRETRKLRISPDPAKRDVGLQAAVTLTELHSLSGLQVTMDHREPITDDTDTDLLYVAEALFPPSRIKPGDLLMVRIDKLGERARQGVGYLKDGRLVVVDDGESYLGGEVEVRVKNVLPTSPGAEIIFAAPIAESRPAQRSE